MTAPNKLDLSNVQYSAHAGGQAHLNTARDHSRADLLFLSYHLGRNLKKISAVAKKKGVELPEAIHSPLYTDLNDSISSLRQQHSQQIHIYHIYCLLVTLLLPIALCNYIFSLSISSALALGLLLVTYAFNIFHMRHHFGGKLYTAGVQGKKTLAHKLEAVTAPFYQLLDEIFMVTPRYWLKQHQASHHIYTNSAADDYDVLKPYPFFCLHPDLTWRWYHRYQSYYAPLALLLNGFAFALDNYFNKGGRITYLCLYYLLMLVLPAYFNGIVPALIAYFTVTAIASIITAYCFQISHNTSSAMRTQQSSELQGVTYQQWIKQQVEESISYGGYLTTLFFGGINLQTEHHIAPALEPTLLHFFRDDLTKICATHKMPYRYLSSASTAIYEYHQHLQQLSRR